MERGPEPIDLAQHLARRWPAEPALIDRLSPSVASGTTPRRRGHGAVLGLVDAALEPEVADLHGAALSVRCFARRAATARALRDHGTCSATLLVGQGARYLRGLLPGARLLVATVAEADGAAPAARVAEGLGWLVDAGATVIAVPMGSRAHEPVLARAIAGAVGRGALVFAARGGAVGEPAWYPAAYPKVRSVSALADGDVPAVGGDGRLGLRGGTSIACVVAAGLAALRSARPA